MGVVPALLFVEVRAIAAAAAILGTKALLRGPGLDQGSIDREMFVRQKRLHLAVVQKLGHELLKHVAVLQPLAVLRKCRRVPYRIIRRKPDEPAVQKIVVQLFHQLPLPADAIEDLEQERAQQLFRRDRGAPLARIELPKGSAQVFQNFPNQFTNLSQWMVLWHARLWRNIRKQSALIPKCPAHPGLQTIRDRN